MMPFRNVDVIETVTTIEEIADLRDEWNALADRQELPFLRHEWCLAAATAFAERERPMVLVSRRAGRVVAIAPMAIVRKDGAQRMEVLGTTVLLEPSGLLYEDEEALAEIVAALPRSGYPVNLRRVPEGAPEVRFAAGCAWLASVRCGSTSAVLHIGTDFAAFEQTMSARRRSDLRRARRRAEALGPVTFESVRAGPDDVDALLDEAFAVEQANYKGETGSAVLSQPAVHSFFRQYGRAAARESMLHVFFMRIGGRAAGTLVTTVFARRAWTLKVGYDNEFARCSPGVLVMHEAIRNSFERGHVAFEFAGYDEPWLHVWTDDVRRFDSPAIYPVSLRGLAGFGVDVARFARRKLEQRWRRLRRA